MKDKSVLLFGHLTRDINIRDGVIYKGVGGSVYFAAGLLKDLGLNVNILSSFDSELGKRLSKHYSIIRAGKYSLQAPIFENRYTKEGRFQKAEIPSSVSLRIDENVIERLSFEPDLVIAGPLYDADITKEIKLLKNSYKNALFTLLLQGFLRKIGKDGQVFEKDFKLKNNSFNSFAVIVFSDKDHKGYDEIAGLISSKGTIVLVTKEDRGCDVYDKGKDKINVPSFKISKIKDATGAGDVFSAAFSYQFKSTGDLVGSVYFAHAAAALSLLENSDGLKYSKQKIFDFARIQGVRL